MLQEIIDIQQEAVAKLVAELKGNKREITFKAPTGSGKTYMMADFMNRVIAEHSNVVFLVSSLSKGDLARQNYEKFAEYKDKGDFPNINPYLINSDIAGEERLYIPTEHNVYLLPRDLYKKGGRLTQGAMLAFLENSLLNAKTIYLIKDECHIATKNLDDLSSDYFTKTINFSATPKLARGQFPDVEIRNEDAENAKLIKTVEWGDDADTVADAVAKFEEIKKDYRDMLGVNPCLIIQISNKDKADDELRNTIMPALNAKPDLKWMLIVDKENDCDTNDYFKAKKLPVAKWKDYAKTSMAAIDVIIFKMVITEGWDIPRACMLYQVRETKSKQLDEQVLGRIRRNPRLLDFETLSDEAQTLAMTAWAWGIKSDEQKRVTPVSLWDEPQETIDAIKVRVTKLKQLTERKDFDIVRFVEKQETNLHPDSIFNLGRQLRKEDNQIRTMVYDYATDYTKWWKIAGLVPELEKESNQYLCDYKQSMEAGDEVSFPVSSQYTDNQNYQNIGNWIWKRRSNTDKFSFDSDAEREWASILKDLSATAMAPLTIGKSRKDRLDGVPKLFGNEVEIDRKVSEKDIYLWGKNFIVNSPIKFEYYMGALHSSYPDFVMKDKYGRIHIFEVKSVNQSKDFNFDNNIYKAKIIELKNCYKQASLLTNQIFYLPIQQGDNWQITRFKDGEEDTQTLDMFKSFVNTEPQATYS